MICFPNKTDCRKQCESSREKVWNDPADTCPLMRVRIKIPYMQVDTCIVDGKSDEAISRGAHMTKMVSNPNRMPEKTELVLFKDGEINLEVPVIPEEETVWLNQAQMVELYGRDTSVISRHIRNIFKEGELDKESNLHFLQIANSDRPVAFYSLDVIISVGYRVKSHRRIAATMFLYFLDRNGILYDEAGNKLLNDHTLVALTIMIAESRPEEKEMMISVIMNCIN